jgi:hypothetical protein
MWEAKDLHSASDPIQETHTLAGVALQPYGFLINPSGLSNATFLTLQMLFEETYASE